jgi:hypothetical protein
LSNANQPPFRQGINVRHDSVPVGPVEKGAPFSQISNFRFSLVAAGFEPAPNTYRGSWSEFCCHTVSGKHIGSFAHPFPDRDNLHIIPA